MMLQVKFLTALRTLSQLVRCFRTQKDGSSDIVLRYRLHNPKHTTDKAVIRSYQWSTKEHFYYVRDIRPWPMSLNIPKMLSSRKHFSLSREPLGHHCHHAVWKVNSIYFITDVTVTPTQTQCSVEKVTQRSPSFHFTPSHIITFVMFLAL